jgi:2-keto-4-pentenoate hydratase/2-oxohepta-3-ene-1,7-dioic acid hydratase in catechol pathway
VRDLVFGVAELIAYYSRVYALRTGDDISSGLPSGAGYVCDPKAVYAPGR